MQVCINFGLVSETSSNSPYHMMTSYIKEAGMLVTNLPPVSNPVEPQATTCPKSEVSNICSLICEKCESLVLPKVRFIHYKMDGFVNKSKSDSITLKCKQTLSIIYIVKRTFIINIYYLVVKT